MSNRGPQGEEVIIEVPSEEEEETGASSSSSRAPRLLPKPKVRAIASGIYAQEADSGAVPVAEDQRGVSGAVPVAEEQREVSRVVPRGGRAT